MLDPAPVLLWEIPFFASRCLHDNLYSVAIQAQEQGVAQQYFLQEARPLPAPQPQLSELSDADIRKSDQCDQYRCGTIDLCLRLSPLFLSFQIQNSVKVIRTTEVVTVP